MLERFKPTWMIERFSDIDPGQLKAHGIKAVFSDLDNTLIAWDNPDGTPELRDWMAQLKQAGIELIVVSNNHAARVSKAVAPLNLPFESRALKPLAVGLKRTLTRFNYQPDEVVMVGDQLMTDVLAANGAGVRSILVKPLLPSDKWVTMPNRWMGNQVMKRLVSADPTMKWQKELK